MSKKKDRDFSKWVDSRYRIVDADGNVLERSTFATKESVTKYLLLSPQCNLISHQLAYINKLRKLLAEKKGGVGTLKKSLFDAYDVFKFFAWTSDEVFCRLDTETEIKPLARHIAAVLKSISATPSWRSTGSLEPTDALMMELAHQFATKHSFAKGVLEEGILANFSDMFSILGDKRFPSKIQSHQIIMLVSNTFSAFKRDPDMPYTKLFPLLHDMGALNHFLRVATQPGLWELCNDAFTGIIDNLISFPRLVTKFYDKDEASKRFLKDLVTGKVGYTPLPNRPADVSQRLQNLSQYATNLGSNVKPTRRCQVCEKLDVASKCSKCKAVWYCGRECQLTHWKTHKKYCKPVSSRDAKTNNSDSTMTHSFIAKNYLSVQREMAKATREHGVSPKELLIEIDYCPDSMGRVPALQNEFSVHLTQAYCDEKKEGDVGDVFYQDIRKSTAFMEDGRVLVVCISNARTNFRLFPAENFSHPDTSLPFFSAEAIEKAGRVLIDKEYSVEDLMAIGKVTIEPLND